MRRIACLLLLVLVSGCASLSVPVASHYPFRAGFSADATIGGEDFQVHGALLISSGTSGVAQIYGPGGLSTFTLTMKDGVLTVHDMWGRQLRQYSIPLKDSVGLIAGYPPGGMYLYRRKSKDSLSVGYSWGTLLLTQDMVPKKIHVRGDPALDVSFNSECNILTLQIIYGSDTLRLSIDIKEGGRWL